MYQAYGDTYYLDKLIDHANSVLASRDSVRGVTDYRGLSLPAWRTDHPPEVLVMDEPTAALDLLMQRSILSLLQNLQEEYDLTVVFITHDLPLVAGLADRLAVMYAFDFVEYGPSSEIVTNAAHPYTRALLRSVPSVDAPLAEMRPIEGESPDPVHDPAGCSYHPRCPVATEQCKTEVPGFEMPENRNPDHQARCFHIEESREEVTYNLRSEGFVE